MSNRSSSPSPVSSNLWDYKPWWCQPWSILLTGVSLPIGSWLILHRLWITAPLVGLILVWWWYFLIVVPRSFAQAAEIDTPTNSSSPASEAAIADSD